MPELINKNISNDQVMEAIKKALMHNIMNIKLYFLIGLPGEEKDTGSLKQKIRRIRAKNSNLY